MQRITPNLWFDSQAEEAARFYVSIFKNSKITHITYYGSEGYDIHGQDEGSVMTVVFKLEGQEFVALNAGNVFQFSEAISFIINCENQKEVDYYRDKLSAGGDPAAQQCGRLKDKFGLSWQVVPTALPKLISDPDVEKTQRVLGAMFAMKKIDVAKLEKAYNGK